MSSQRIKNTYYVSILCLAGAFILFSCNGQQRNRAKADYIEIVDTAKSVTETVDIIVDTVAIIDKPKQDTIVRPKLQDNEYHTHRYAKVPNGFTSFSHRYQRKRGKSVFLRYDIDFVMPVDTMQYGDERFAQWIVKRLLTTVPKCNAIHEQSLYMGDPFDTEAIAKYLANCYFRNNNYYYIDCDISENYKELVSHVEWMKKHYVTFYKYEDTYQCGAAHSNYTENFLTYDLMRQKALTNEEIFKKDSFTAVKEILFQTAFSDKRFMESHLSYTIKDVRKLFVEEKDPNRRLENSVEKWHLPNAALVKNGVVFSFQPYEIDCFAAGCYHFLIPYSKLKGHLKLSI